jgi:hypothetical protein
VRAVTTLTVLLYLSAAAYHFVDAGRLGPATIAEALLGLVLLGALAGLITSMRLAYLIVLAGTLLGLTIVIVSGARGVDVGIHVVMLAGLVIGFALMARQRGQASA